MPLLTLPLRLQTTLVYKGSALHQVCAPCGTTLCALGIVSCCGSKVLCPPVYPELSEISQSSSDAVVETKPDRKPA